MGTDHDQLIEWLEENDAPPEVLKLAKGSGLRKELATAHAEIERLKPFESKVVSLEKAPVRNKAFTEVAKVDFTKLSVAEQEKVDSFDWDGDEPDAEAVTAFVEKYKLPTLAEAPSATQELGGAAAIANQASTANPSFPPPANSVREQIAEYEQLAAKARQEGDTASMQTYTQAALTLKTASLRPEGLEATPV